MHELKYHSVLNLTSQNEEKKSYCKSLTSIYQFKTANQEKLNPSLYQLIRGPETLLSRMIKTVESVSKQHYPDRDFAAWGLAQNKDACPCGMVRNDNILFLQRRQSPLNIFLKTNH